MNQELFNQIYDNSRVMTDKDARMAQAWANAVVRCYHAPMPNGEPGYVVMGMCLDKEQLTRYFWAIRRCECCSRHLMARPVAIDSEILTPSSPRPRNCDCLCRHNLRWLKLAYKSAK